MSLGWFLLFFRYVLTTALLSKNMQAIVSEKLVPRDLLKAKMFDRNWRGETIFDRVTPTAGLFQHKETGEITFETKNNSSTESEIIGRISNDDWSRKQNKNLISKKDWNNVFFELCGRVGSEDGLLEALAEIVDVNARRVDMQTYGNYRCVLNMTALMESLGHINVVETLLNRKADVNAKDEIGYTALHWAARTNKKVKVLEILLKFGAVLEAVDDDSYTPLVLAVLHDRLDAVRFLLKKGADTNKLFEIPKGIIKLRSKEILKLLKAHRTKETLF